MWDRIRQGELYYFKGTNIIAASFTPGKRPILPDSEGDAHGVATAAAVVTANPQAILLFVEDRDSNPCRTLAATVALLDY